MAFSKNYSLASIAVGAIEWPSIWNQNRDRIEAGRTIRVIAGVAIAAGEALTPPDSAGRVFRATNLTLFGGIAQAAIALNAEGFMFAGIGNEITVGTGWTVGGLIFVGTAAGTLTQVRPTPEVIPIGYANTATSIVLGRPVIDDRSQPVSYHFMQSDVPASLTAVAIPVLGLAGNTEIVMPRAGSVVGISIASNAPRTGGTLTVDVAINGVATGLQAILDVTNTQYHLASRARRVSTFAAGARLGVLLTTATWAPITADIVVCVLVEV